MEALDTRYNQNEEPDIYDLWEKSGIFTPETSKKRGITDAEAPPFVVVLPPPNVTGTLHIGHAFEDTVQDIFVRYHRMLGEPTLWIPGTDHAAIATQAKVEKILSKEEGKSKYDLGRDEFLKRVNAFAKESHDTITRQIRRLGASLDWSREAYTLDEKRNLAVRTAFKRMYDLGLIYRADRIVNWDPKGQTVISDDEVVYEERPAKLYTFRYSKDFPISISTTRPETKVGDTAVAVHPEDQRYKKFVGKIYEANFCGAQIKVKIVADSSVEMDFGTGALGVTPAHSMIDWEIASRHDLPLVQVIDEYGKMMVEDVRLKGKKTIEAREVIVAWLKNEGLLEKEEDVTQNVSTSERTGAVIEPLPKLQWFIGVNKEFVLEHSSIHGIPSGSKTTLKEIMRKSVSEKQIKILPERFEKVYFHWIDNLRDWCISRQLWFGHRIPVWYRSTDAHGKPNGIPSDSRGVETYVNVEPPKGSDWEQDSDTLDTWFSSGMWTFSTLGWPEKTEDLKRYHPNAFMCPGYEIIFMWVARMILMSGCLLGEIPFRTVLFHGIVRDSQGRKFSKSIGNGIDPLELANTYGADALRMALVIGAAPGNDVTFSEDRVRGYRNFSTKIWNLARFLRMNSRPEFSHGNHKFDEGDRATLQEFEAVKKAVTNHIENFDLHLAAEGLYHYVWHTFADKVVEEAKPRLQGDDSEKAHRAYHLLDHILVDCLKMLHPFMPFVTEAVYRKSHPNDLLTEERWPYIPHVE